MGQTLRMGTLKEWVSLCFVTESFIYYLSGERTHVQRHAPSRLPCGLGFYDNGSRPRPPNVVQYKLKQRHVDVHVAGTFGPSTVRRKKSNAHSAVGCLCIRISHLPGI